MINEKYVRSYCAEDIILIENYAEAIADKDNVWDCHHRAEILMCGRFSINDLKRFGLYYKRPSSELIFLRHDEHRRLHMIGVPKSAEHRRKMSEAKKGENHPCYGKHLSEEHRRKISEAQKGEKNHWYGKHLGEETRRKISEAKKGEKNHFYGKHHSAETRRKISEARKLYWRNKK